MKKKVLIAKLITFIGITIGVLSITLLKNFSSFPPVLYITCGAVCILVSVVIGYFYGRCPDCHKPLHLHKHILKYCPYCGKHL